MLTSPHRENKRGGQGRGLGRERPGSGEATAVDTHAEGSTSIDYSAAGVRLTSPENNRMCGWVEGWPGGSTAGHGRREYAVPPVLVWAAGAGRSEIEEARRTLDGYPTVTALC